MDVTFLQDTINVQKEREKVKKYIYLSMELKGLWRNPMEVVPLIFGSLGGDPTGPEEKSDGEQCRMTSDYCRKCAVRHGVHSS